LVANDFTEPSTYKEAVKHKEWKQAMIEEYQVVIDNNTWKLVDSIASFMESAINSKFRPV
jgi:hypothetical protein